MFPIRVNEFLALGGFAVLVTVIVNILKAVKVVQDGQAQTWSFLLNLAGFILFSALGMLNPTIDWGAIDATIAAVASVLIKILELATMPAISKLAHEWTMKSVPVLGFSYSARAEQKALAKARK
jgi:quinol-cytochrome oxidoreductase complex cytochrome b subunit